MLFIYIILSGKIKRKKKSDFLCFFVKKSREKLTNLDFIRILDMKYILYP